MKFLEQKFYSQATRKRETNYYLLWTLRLTITKVKTSKLITFCHYFALKIGKKLS